MTLYADVHPPTLYEAPAPAQLNRSSSVNATVPEEPTQSSTSRAQLPSSASAGYPRHAPSTGSGPTSTTELSTSAALRGPETDQETPPTRKQPPPDLSGSSYR